MDLFDALLRIVLVSEAVHLTCEVHDAILHLYVYTAELLIDELLLTVGLDLCVRSLLRFCKRNGCTEQQREGCTSQNAAVSCHELSPTVPKVLKSDSWMRHAQTGAASTSSNNQRYRLRIL